MSATQRTTTRTLVGGTLIMLVLAGLATWALTNFTLGPQMFNGVVLPPRTEAVGPPKNFWERDLPNAWVINNGGAVVATLGQWSYISAGGAQIVTVPSDWATVRAAAGEPLELVIDHGRIKDVKAYLAPVVEPTPRDEPLPITSITQQDGFTVVTIDPVPPLADQVLMLVAEFDTKRGSDYAEYRWRLNP